MARHLIEQVPTQLVDDRTVVMIRRHPVAAIVEPAGAIVEPAGGRALSVRSLEQP